MANLSLLICLIEKMSSTFFVLLESFKCQCRFITISYKALLIIMSSRQLFRKHDIYLYVPYLECSEKYFLAEGI
jgi:hypothetical protein